MDSERQTNMHDGSNRSLTNNIWPKTARKNFVPLLCIIFLLVFTQYEIINKWRQNNNLEDFEDSTGTNKYGQLAQLLTRMAMPLKQNISDNSTQFLNL